MSRRWVVIVVLAGAVLSALGDTIDDAEAKRRGVPVAQVQAENALAGEKRKTAGLEQQIAALEKKIDEAKAGAPAANPVATLPAAPAQAAIKQVPPPIGAISEPVPAGVVRADDLLAKFPANVPPKGSKIVVQGRYVFQRVGPALPLLRDAKGMPTQAYTKYISVTGTNQDDGNPVHLTCLLDRLASAKLDDVQYESVVRVSGTIGDTDKGMGKVELTQCDALEVVPLPPKSLDAQVVGSWFGEYPPPASIMGDFQFKPDHTMTATFQTQQGALTLAGKWQPKENGEEKKINLVLERTDGPVDLEFVNGHLHVPTIMPLYYFPDPNTFADFRQHDGPPIKESLTQAQNQLLEWVRTNCVAAQQATVLNAAATLIGDNSPMKGNYSLTLDGQLTRTGKTTQLCVSEAELFVFEYSDEQAKASQLAAGATRGIMRAEEFKVGDSAMKIESVTLEQGNSLDATTRIKGKAMVRAITEGGVGGHNLEMVCGGRREDLNIPGGVGLDDTTVDFSFQPLAKNKNDDAAKKRFGNQLVICFFMSTEVLERDSNIVAKLVDVSY